MNTLGIDLGTTKIAVVVADENGTPLAVESAAHHADLPAGPNGAEQDFRRLLQTAGELCRKLPAKLKRSLGGLGLTGQMHSVVLQKAEEFSALITWQDHRCGAEMLRRFQEKSSRPLREGFGGTTLARLAAEGALDRWDRAAPAAAALGSFLCGNAVPVTDPTHAASWGLYDLRKEEWDRDAARALDIPERFLPEIRPCGSPIGAVADAVAEAWDIPAGIPVLNAVGDNQASVLGTGREFDRELYLTLGTGAQLSFVLDRRPENLPENWEIRPFPGHRFLLVNAPLCGGSAFAFLADMTNAFFRDLGFPEQPRGELLDRLDALALPIVKSGGCTVTAVPSFLGERHAPDLRGGFGGLTLRNATPGQFGAALALGIARSLKQGLPDAVLRSRRRLIGSGNAVRLLKSVQCALRQEFQLPLILSDVREEAAVGALAFFRFGSQI